ncbi:MAG: 30S ribosomal protein S20 [Planctomycetota bacterium]|nr:30S ribosomal protein S20 [Planctomycetota bacterium]
MPNSNQAKKRLRQDKSRTLANKSRMSRIRTEIKTFSSLVGEKNVEAATKQFALVTQLVDKAAKTNLVHKNWAARNKSKLAARLNTIQASG